MLKPLNLNDADREQCSVIYNVNRFEVYHREGWMMFAAYDLKQLERELEVNAIKWPRYSDGAARMKHICMVFAE